MIVKEISVRRYRNLEDADIRLDEGLNVLSGANAQGKTNLLEALFVLCTGRSHRTRHDAELIRYGEETAGISAEVEHTDGVHLLAMELSAKGRKKIRVNHSPLHRMGELMGHLNGVLFSPEDLYLVKEGPAWRRRFVDMTLSQVKPSYFYALQEYQQALAQRNVLLKQIARENTGRETLPVWNAQLANAGARLVGERRRFAQRLSEETAAVHAELTSGREELKVRYASALAAGSESETREAILQALEKGLERDLRMGNTMSGPHHDDLELRLGERDVRIYASQGQQRTCVLSLKLAELAIMRETAREAPILLLDDVFSELDTARRHQLEKTIGEVQTLVTCVDGERLLMSGACPVRMMAVENGKILPIEGEKSHAEAQNSQSGGEGDQDAAPLGEP